MFIIVILIPFDHMSLEILKFSLSYWSFAALETPKNVIKLLALKAKSLLFLGFLNLKSLFFLFLSLTISRSFSLYPDPMMVILLLVFSSIHGFITAQIPENSIGALIMNILPRISG